MSQPPELSPTEAPPSADAAPPAGPVLWNPNAAAAWGLLLSPVFSAVLHMMNWQALGEPEKAHVAKQWVIGLVTATLGTTLVLIIWPESRQLDTLSRIVGVALLVAWYYGAGKAQATRVAALYGRGYPRRGWIVPVLAALGLIVGLSFVFGGLDYLWQYRPR